MNLSTHIPITFVIPDVNAFQSGGNIYNKNLIGGLRKNGYDSEILDFVGFKKKKIHQLEGHYFFDTLYFTHLESIFTKKNKDTQFWLIVHHLESLYPPKDWTVNDYFQQKEQPFLVQFDGFLTSSQFTADYLLEHGLTQNKIVIPPAISVNAKLNHMERISRTCPDSYRDGSSKPFSINALMVANLVERKGILPFLEYLLKSALLQQNVLLKIHLVGSETIEPIYAQRCLDLLTQNPALKKIVHYHGQLSPTQLHSYYQRSNLFISTAFMETYGMALQEARSFELPILAINGGNVKNHVIEGVTGYLVGDVPLLINQLELMVNAPNLLADLQRNINDEIPNFYNWEQASIQLIQRISTL